MEMLRVNYPALASVYDEGLFAQTYPLSVAAVSALSTLARSFHVGEKQPNGFKLETWHRR